MSSPLLAVLDHFWLCDQAAGNRINNITAGDPLIPSGSIAKATGIMSGGYQADVLAGSNVHANHLAIPGKATGNATGPWFDTDFTVGMFVRWTTIPPDGLMFGRGQWYDSFDFALRSSSGNLSPLLGTGAAVAPFLTTPNNPYGNGNMLANTWYWVAVRHTVASKTLEFFLARADTQASMQVVSATYTGTIGRSTLPFRITGANTDSVFTPREMSVQGIFHANQALSDKNLLALYNRGRGLAYPFTAYATENGVPDAATVPVIAQVKTNVLAQQYSSNGQDTALTPRLNVRESTVGLSFGWVNAVHGFQLAEGFETAKQTAITIEASYFIEGVDAAAIPLTFNGGASSATMTYGQTAFSDPVDRVFHPTHNIRVLVYYSAAGGITAVPATLQFTGSSGRRGTGTKTITDITLANYTTDAGQFACFGPSILKGRVVGPATRNTELAIRGDSTAAGGDSWAQVLSLNGGFSYYPMAVSACSSFRTAPTANDVGATNVTKQAYTIMDMLGINDIQEPRNYAQLVADKTTCWTRWLGTGSNAQKLFVTTITPVGSVGGAANAATRASWNTFVRSTGTNADFGAMTGRPTIVKRWDGTDFVSSGARSGGTGANLDVYVIDIAEVTESDHLANNNQWSTTTAGGTKVNCSTVNAGDKIHPDATEHAAIAAMVQSRFNTAVAAPAPEITIDDEDGEETMTIDSSNDFPVTIEWSEVTAAAGKQFRFGFHGEGQKLWWKVAATAPSASAVGDVAKSDQPQFADTVAAGKKLYVRTDNPFTVIVHVSA